MYTLRSCVPPRKWAAVLAASAGALLFGLLARAIETLPERAFANVAAEGILGLAVPIAALVIGDAVLGAEIHAGTFHFTWLTPVPIWQIVVGRWLGGVLVAAVTITPACALAAVIAGAPGAAGPVALAAFVASVSYIAIFITIGCVTRRTAVVARLRVPRRTTARCGLDRHRPALADMGVTRDLRRHARRRPGSPRPRRHPRRRSRRRPPAHRHGGRAATCHLAPWPPPARRGVD